MGTEFALKAGVSLTPALVLLLVFAYLDVFKLVRLGKMVLFLLAGAALGASGFFGNARALGRLSTPLPAYSRYGAPVVEETLKAAFILVLFAMNRIGFKLDAAVIGFAVGAGFSVAE